MGRRMGAWGCLAAVLAASIAGAGCSRTMSLAYTRPVYADRVQGAVCLAVVDERSPDRGGRLIGEAYLGWRWPSGLQAKEDRQPPLVLREVMIDSLAAAGFRVEEDATTTPTVVAHLRSVWCDGIQNYEMSLAAWVDLRSPDGATLWSFTLDARGRTVYSMGSGDLDAGYRQMLEDAVDKLTNQFRSPEFRVAVGALTGAVP